MRSPSERTSRRPLWVCPKCGHRFVTKNLWHSCVRSEYVDATLWLRRPAEHPLLRRTEDFGALGYGLHFRLTDPGDVDSSLARLVREADRLAKPGPGRR